MKNQTLQVMHGKKEDYLLYKFKRKFRKTIYLTSEMYDKMHAEINISID